MAERLKNSTEACPRITLKVTLAALASETSLPVFQSLLQRSQRATYLRRRALAQAAIPAGLGARTRTRRSPELCSRSRRHRGCRVPARCRGAGTGVAPAGQSLRAHAAPSRPLPPALAPQPPGGAAPVPAPAPAFTPVATRGEGSVAAAAPCPPAGAGPDAIS